MTGFSRWRRAVLWASMLLVSSGVMAQVPPGLFGDPMALEPTAIAPTGRLMPEAPTRAPAPLPIEPPKKPAETVAPPAPKTEFQRFVESSLGKTLPIFGIDFFGQETKRFGAVENSPVTPDYVVGPGDELLLRVWGQTSVDTRLVVDRQGNVSVPRVGVFSVAAVSYKDLADHLRQQIGRYYRNFDLSVSLGQLRGLQVYVAGHAQKPGSFSVSGMSTLMNAVFAAGGPSASGSMRKIQLKRRGNVVTELDLYDLLILGDTSKDSPLQSGDVIHFAPLGPVVAVHGAVNASAIFELKSGKESLKDLLAWAGGLAVTAEGNRVTVERIEAKKQRTVAEFSLDDAGLARAVQGGDVMTVYALSARFSNEVSLKGFVAQPLRAPWREGIKISDLIPGPDVLATNNYWQRRNQFSLGTPRRTESDCNPSDSRLSDSRLSDSRLSDSRLSDSRLSSVGAENEGKSRGSYESDGACERRRLADSMGSIQLESVNWDYAVVERKNTDHSHTILPFNLRKAVIDKDLSNDLPLMPGDVVTVFSTADLRVPMDKRGRFLRLEGELRIPGVFPLQPGETLRQAIKRLGGVSPNAYLFGTEFTRETTRRLQQRQLDESLSRLEQAVSRANAAQAGKALSAEDAATAKATADNRQQLVEKLKSAKATGRIVLGMPQKSNLTADDLPEIVLEDGDVLYVPPLPSTVSVLGSVFNPNSFVYKRDEDVNFYLTLSGGPTKDADADSLYLLRADGSVSSNRQSTWLSSWKGQEVLPGDAVIAPEAFERFNLTKELKDWSQIIYQFALGVAGLKVLRD